MPTKTPKELFVMLLADARQRAEKAEKNNEGIGQLVQDPRLKEALRARRFISNKVLATLEKRFKLLGDYPVTLTGRMRETLVEDFRRELAYRQKHFCIGETQSPCIVSDQRVPRSNGSSRSGQVSWGPGTGNPPCGESDVDGANTKLPQRNNTDGEGE